MRHLQVTCSPPFCSLHLQPAPSFPVKQAQLDLRAHCGSQPQAGPPLADSSQYQPLGQTPAPQGLQVPSSQSAAFGASLGSVAGSSLSVASSVCTLGCA